VSLASKHCTPCRAGAAPITGETLQLRLRQVGGWDSVGDHHLTRIYRFADFAAALDFTNRVGWLAEAEGHHPEIHLAWGRVRVDVWTHKAGGLTESDFIFAAKLNQTTPQGGQMSTNQAIRDAQAGNQPAIVQGLPGDRLSLLAAARTTGVAEADLIKVLDRIGASCQIEQILVNRPAARSVIVRLEPGNEVPWHRHTRATNVYVCLEGTMIVETRGPDNRVELTPGQTHSVPAQQFHRAVGNGECRFVIVHKDGDYDVRLGG
jgi:4a-hydroxytetrahydrobiopterin dehydratase